MNLNRTALFYSPKSKSDGEKRDEVTLPSSKSLSRCSTPEARELIPYELALKLKFLPLGLITTAAGEVLSGATCEAADGSEIINAIKFRCGRQVHTVKVAAEVLIPAIFGSYNGDSKLIVNSLNLLAKADSFKRRSTEEYLEIPKPSGEVGKFLTSLTSYALALGASDLHILPRLAGCFIKARINGEILTRDDPVCSLEKHAELIQRIKILSKLDTTQHALPQDGSLLAAAGDRSTQVRVSIMPTIHGEKAVLRFMRMEGVTPLAKIGIGGDILELIQKVISGKEGMILFSGSTGSGKSTTLYALMDELKQTGMNLVSVEDPVEQFVDGISQTSINEKVGLTYSICLRSILRQDPDAILIGEIRDAESAAIALQAALTGHLIFSTVHGRDVFDVLLRLKELKADLLSVSQSVSLIVCQRLIPKLCQACRVFDLVGSNARGFTLYKKVGCKECDYSGYSGQVLACEALELNPCISSLIADGKLRRSELLNAAKNARYISMDTSLLSLLQDGLIEGDQLVFSDNYE